MASGQASSCTAARQFGSGRRHEHQLHHDFSVLDGLTGKSARGGESAAERSSYQRVPPVEQLLDSDGIFWSRVDGDIDETGCSAFPSDLTSKHMDMQVRTLIAQVSCLPHFPQSSCRACRHIPRQAGSCSKLTHHAASYPSYPTDHLTSSISPTKQQHGKSLVLSYTPINT